MKQAKKNMGVFFILILAAGTVYKVPYLKAVFYDQLIQDLAISNAQLGTLGSFYATCKMLVYLPCGIIADKLNTKRLLIASLAGESALTLIYAALPGVGVLNIVHGLYAVVNIFFWTSFIKSIRMLAGQVGQGKIFGLSEGFRGILGSVATLAGIEILKLAAYRFGAIRWVLLFYTVLYGALAVGLCFLYPDAAVSGEDRRQHTFSNYIKIFKTPGIWLVSLLIFSTYSVQIAFEYTTAYLTQVVGIGVSAAGLAATFRDNICGIFASPLSGAAVDKTKSSGGVILWLAAAEMLMAAVFVFLLAGRGRAGITILFILVFAFVHYGIRGVYYMAMSDVGIPIALTSTATAVVAMLGYTPDIFMHVWCGKLLDRYGAQAGFSHIFRLMLLFSMASLGIAVALRQYQIRIKYKQNKEKGAITNERE